MSYKDISKDEDCIYATRVSDNAAVTIDRSISDIYVAREYMQLKPLSIAKVNYQAVSFMDHQVLIEIRNLFLGIATDADLAMLDNTMIRFGWLDRTLNSLQWLPVLELYRRWCNGELTSSQKNKLNAICKALSLSRKDMVATVASDAIGAVGHGSNGAYTKHI